MKRYIIMAFLSLMSTVYVSAQGPSIVGSWAMAVKQTTQEKQYVIMNFDDQGGVFLELHLIMSTNEINLSYIAKVKGHYERSVKAISQEFDLNSLTCNLDIDAPQLTTDQKNLLRQEMKKTGVEAQTKQLIRTMIAQGNFKQIVSLSDEMLVIGRPGQKTETFFKGGIEEMKKM